MITRLKVKNYCSIEEIDLPLSPLTVLVGKNGAGKSTILDVLAFVRDALSDSLAAAVRKRSSIDSILRWTPNHSPLDIEISVDFVTNDISGSYSFTFGVIEKNKIAVKHEICTIEGLAQDSFEYRANENEVTKSTPEDKLSLQRLVLPFVTKAETNNTVLDAVISLLTNTDIYNITPDDIREPQEVTGIGSLKGDGSNIGEVLSQIAKDECEKQRFCEMLGYMIGGVEDLRVTEAGGYFITELKHHQKDGKSWFNLAHESEGTLKALAFLTAIYQEHTHSLIALEEPDANLYYRAIGGVTDTLREGVLRRQIIVTTQSPDFLSHFDIDEIRVVEKVNGVTKVGMLEETQRKAVERKLFSVPELLRMEDLHRDNAEEDEGVSA